MILNVCMSLSSLFPECAKAHNMIVYVYYSLFHCSTATRSIGAVSESPSRASRLAFLHIRLAKGREPRLCARRRPPLPVSTHPVRPLSRQLPQLSRRSDWGSSRVDKNASPQIRRWAVLWGNILCVCVCLICVCDICVYVCCCLLQVYVVKSIHVEVSARSCLVARGDFFHGTVGCFRQVLC